MNFTSKPRWTLIIGLLGASGVALGAIAAHALAEPAATAVERASTYQILHAIALLVLCAASGTLVAVARWAMLAGIVGFSGAIYAKYLLNLPALGALAPLGGSLLILSWVLLAVSWIGPRPTPSDKK
jgi:uncharacterized membrane protein YgdD (TMEM256/DUF423 family)